MSENHNTSDEYTDLSESEQNDVIASTSDKSKKINAKKKNRRKLKSQKRGKKQVDNTSLDQLDYVNLPNQIVSLTSSIATNFFTNFANISLCDQMASNLVRFDSSHNSNPVPNNSMTSVNPCKSAFKKTWNKETNQPKSFKLLGPNCFDNIPKKQKNNESNKKTERLTTNYHRSQPSHANSPPQWKSVQNANPHIPLSSTSTAYSQNTAAFNSHFQKFSNFQKLPPNESPRFNRNPKQRHNSAPTRFSDSHNFIQLGPTTSQKYTRTKTHTSNSDNFDRSKHKKKKQEKEKNKEDSENKQGFKFADYITAAELLERLESGELIKGPIRINQRSFREAYVTNPTKFEQDIFIDDVANRNRALEGDTVAVKINPKSEWRPNGQKTGVVVYIVEKYHSRRCVGVLKLMADKNKKWAQFIPRDSRVPRLRIPYEDCPDSFYERAKEFENTLFLAAITSWDDTRYAVGKIIETVGECDNLKSETTALLLENGLDATPHPPETNAYFPKIDAEIPAEEIAKRIDLRKECIFTIDPLTARDLDDAMSCKKLPNGNLEVGVHISDVTHYLAEDTPLDKIVSRKATTIYLVESVYHMLPRDLCLLCSLLPDQDKLSYSVIWEMTEEGNILNCTVSRSIIRSCAQLAYEHAQMMLDDPDNFDRSKLPEIYNGFGSDDLSETVNRLNKISKRLRKKRFDEGALKIDQPKIVFRLDKETGLPLNYFIYENKESHRLIEEFMLLANITVAERLNEHFPELAFLRRHSAPLAHMMESLKQTFEKIGIHLDISSAGSLNKSIQKYGGADLLSQSRMIVLNALCAKPMSRAQYFCAAKAENEDDFSHYALNVPLYTHFTSPIRRYADVMVHRLLSASLGYAPPPDWEVDTVSEIAANCNKMKYNAKKAGEQSSDLYLIRFIRLKQPLIETAVVIDVKDRSFDACVLSMGLNVRVYTNDDKLLPATIVKKQTDSVPSLTIFWPADATHLEADIQIVEIFSLLKVELTVNDSSPPKLFANLVRPT